MSPRCLLQLAVCALLLGRSVEILAQESTPASAAEEAPAPASAATPRPGPEPSPASAASAPVSPAPLTKEDLFPEKPPPPRKWTVTTFPLLLFAPILEVTVERRLNRNLGVAFMLGGGSFKPKSNMPGGVDTRLKVLEIGTSARYYGLGSFRKGLQFGAAVEYIRFSGDNIDGSMTSAFASGLLLAGFLGYKYTWSFGLTLEGQLGPAFAAIEGETDDGATQESVSRVTAYLNLNAGWSF